LNNPCPPVMLKRAKKKEKEKKEKEKKEKDDVCEF
jgi:hypothetical protein